MNSIPAWQHSAPEPCPAAAGMELVERWRRLITQVQTEIDRDVYGNGKTDTYFKEDAANKLDKALTSFEEAMVCLKKEMRRIEDGE